MFEEEELKKTKLHETFKIKNLILDIKKIKTIKKDVIFEQTTNDVFYTISFIDFLDNERILKFTNEQEMEDCLLYIKESLKTKITIL